MTLRVLTWNLLHGRSVPPAGRDLFDAFADLLATWEWDVALLQEVPPWWPPGLAERAGAEQRLVLTSRNSLLAVRRAVAERWPDVAKSNGGGCNAILVRGEGIAEHRVQRLGWWPERRWMHAVRLSRGWWVGNLHTEADPRQGRAAAATLLGWAARAPVVLGGDFNLRELSPKGFTRAGGDGVDQVFVGGGLVGDGLVRGGLSEGRQSEGRQSEGRQSEGRQSEVLERGSLSDHAPVVVSVMKEGP
jgi:endonuclease/exonuclease/phosphatase family metal-dependent hydrolase